MLIQTQLSNYEHGTDLITGASYLTFSEEERSLLEEKLFFEDSYLATDDMIKLAQRSRAFDFLYNEPELYSLEHGEPI